MGLFSWDGFPGGRPKDPDLLYSILTALTRLDSRERGEKLKRNWEGLQDRGELEDWDSKAIVEKRKKGNDEKTM